MGKAQTESFHNAKDTTVIDILVRFQLNIVLRDESILSILLCFEPVFVILSVQYLYVYSMCVNIFSVSNSPLVKS